MTRFHPTGHIRCRVFRARFLQPTHRHSHAGDRRPPGAPVIRFHLTGHTRSVQAGHSFLALVFSSTLTPMAGPHLEHP